MKPFHCNITPNDVLGNNGRGRIFLVPGSNERAKRIATDFLSTTHLQSSERGHHLYLGTTTDGIDVGVISTGMGCPSMDIIASELINAGAKHLIRIGTAGCFNSDTCPIGSIVIASGAVRDEDTSQRYAPLEVPAIPCFNMQTALIETAKQLDFPVKHGIIHTKSSLYAREFYKGALGDESKKYMDILKTLGIVASEMEASQLFILGLTHGVSTSAVCTIVGGDNKPFSNDSDMIKKGIDMSIRLTLTSLKKYLDKCT